MTREISAGGLVLRRMRGREFLAVVLVKGGTVRALPKGHVDPGESSLQAAVREVREETGLEVTGGEKLGDVRYWYVRRGGTRVFKIVTFFLFRHRAGSLRDYDPGEVDGAEWIPLADAPALLAYRGEREMAALAIQRLG